MIAATLAYLIAGLPTAEIKWEPFTLSAGLLQAEGQLGRLTVPENRKKQNGKTIEIAFLRLKCTGKQPGPPVVYLDGGPGSSAINLARSEIYFKVFEKLREVGDVILLDQRGIGRSRPALLALSNIRLPSDFFLSKETMVAPFKARLKEARPLFESKGVDLHAFNTEQSADDVDDLRQALGVDQIDILGFSYGTHLGLSVIRRHGDHIAAAALVGTEGPDDTMKLPLEGDRQIEKLAALVKADPALSAKIPDFKALVKRVLDKLEREPVKVKIAFGSAKEREVTVGKYGFQHLICRDLGDTNDHPFFPLGFYQADKGDYSMIRFLAEKRFREYDLGTPLLAIVNDCSSGATKFRIERAQREAKTALFGNAMNFVDELAEAVGNPDLGDAYRSPVRSNVRTLFVSGTLDWNTPPEHAEAIRKGFARSTHIIVGNAGHESSLPQPEIQQAIVDFFRGRDVSKVKVSIPPPKFMPLP